MNLIFVPLIKVSGRALKVIPSPEKYTEPSSLTLASPIVVLFTGEEELPPEWPQQPARLMHKKENRTTLKISFESSLKNFMF